MRHLGPSTYDIRSWRENGCWEPLETDAVRLAKSVEKDETLGQLSEAPWFVLEFGDRGDPYELRDVTSQRAGGQPRRLAAVDCFPLWPFFLPSLMHTHAIHLWQTTRWGVLSSLRFPLKFPQTNGSRSEREGITSISKRCNFHAIMRAVRAESERPKTEMRKAGK